MNEEQKEILKEKLKNLFNEKLDSLTNKFENDINTIETLKYSYFDNFFHLSYNLLYFAHYNDFFCFQIFHFY